MAHQDPAKIRMAELLLSGMNWEEAAKQAGVVISRSSAYWFVDAYCLRGEKVLEEQRRGHAHKLVGDVLAWLLAKCREKPESTARELREAIDTRFGVRVNKDHINRVRRAYGLNRPKKSPASARVSGKKAPGAWSCWQRQRKQD
jgi:transposase